MNQLNILVRFILHMFLLIISIKADRNNRRDSSQNSQLCNLQCIYPENDNCRICYCSTSPYYTLDSCISDTQKKYSIYDESRCMKQCCGSLYLSSLFTKEYLQACKQNSQQSQIFTILGTVSFVAFVVFFCLFILCRICRSSSYESLGCIQTLKKFFCCCRNSVIPAEDIYNASNQNLAVSHQYNQLFQGNDQILIKNILDCSICLEGRPNGITSCNHYFHCKCIKQWIKRDPVCPLCKNRKFTPIKSYCNNCLKKYNIVDGHKSNILRKLQSLQLKKCRNCLQEKFEVEDPSYSHKI